MLTVPPFIPESLDTPVAPRAEPASGIVRVAPRRGQAIARQLVQRPTAETRVRWYAAPAGYCPWCGYALSSGAAPLPWAILRCPEGSCECAEERSGVK
jgi:hypothetical protein